MKYIEAICILILMNTILPKSGISQYPQDTVYHPVVPNDLSKPGYLQTVYDDIYNVDITRISDATTFGFPEGSGQLQPGYAKTQAWNSDMTKVQVGFTMILNASDYSIYKNVDGVYVGGYYNDGRWSNIDPDKRYFCWNNVLLTIDIENEIIDTVKIFSDYEDIRIGPFEGNISADDRYVVITDINGTKATLYDILNDNIVATKDFGAISQHFDWASITPSNDYIVVTNRTTENTELYDLSFTYLRGLTTGNNQHADFAVDAFGNEVLVQVIPLSMTRLSDGVTTDLISDAWVCDNYHFNPGLAGHISGRNLDNPGWALCSTQIAECSNENGYYYRTEMFSVKLDGSGTIKPFGFSYTSCTTYDSYSKASISPDGTKVIFSSDWNLLGSDDNHVLTYVANTANVSAIDENHAKNTTISIVPNPANDVFEVKGEGIENVKIYDNLGRLILNTNDQQINISSITKGYYVVIVTTKDSVFTKELLKQ